jgi:hypothetical protein
VMTGEKDGVVTKLWRREVECGDEMVMTGEKEGVVTKWWQERRSVWWLSD